MVRLLISILTVVGLSACEMVPKASLDEALVRHADELDALTAYQTSLEQEVERLGAEVASLGVSLDERRAFDAREASAEIDRATQELREAMAGLVRSGDVEFLDGPEGPVLRIRNQVLFASGSALWKASRLLSNCRVVSRADSNLAFETTLKCGQLISIHSLWANRIDREYV